MHRTTRSSFAFSLVALASLFSLGCGGGGDGKESVASQGGSGAPQASNLPPVIQGKPGSTVAPSQSFSFQPSASDPDSANLTFSASNLPAWAAIDRSTGRLSGTPTAADIGTYSNITITVSDGSSTAALGPFSITVTDAGNGSATLSWLPPVQNLDGSPLTNLAGYEIRYGVDEAEMSNVVSLSNPSLSMYVVDNLTSGTWYFAVVAVNSSGVASPLSDVASKTIG
jgi:uncharacterized protein YidB (DUF937 family)